MDKGKWWIEKRSNTNNIKHKIDQIKNV
jgi:hypothetical protein